MGDRLRTQSWGQAIALARQVGYQSRVVVPKTVEPALPSYLDARPSNFPWSIHEGATRVYREDTPGEHLQIREFPDRWEVSLDRSNPHHRPISHARRDVPRGSIFSLPTFLFVRGVGTTVRFPLTAANVSLELLSDSKLLQAHRYLPKKLRPS